MATLPSVTRVLSRFVDFSRVPPDVLEMASDRGTRVHAICAAIAQSLFIPSVPDDCRGYVESFKGWFDSVVVEVVAVELEVKSRHGYIGHLDLLCRIKGDSGRTLIDLKTPVVKQQTWKPQIAAYRSAAEENGYGPITRSASMRLNPQGKAPQFDDYTNHPADFAAFLSALNCWRYFGGKNEHRL